MKIFVLVVTAVLISSSLPTRALPNSPFTSFDPQNEGFTQQVVGISNIFLGGVAFAANGNPIVDNCQGGGGSLTQFDLSTTYVSHSTALSPSITYASNVGCGITNHPDGFIYSNTYRGVTKVNPETGVEYSIGGNPLGGTGIAGDALGITVDPVTNNIFYVSSTSNIVEMNPTTGASTTFATVGGFVDGIFWDAAGNYLYIAQRSLSPVGVWRIDRTGTIDMKIPTGATPDGIAFHVPSRDVFVNALDGTIRRINLDVSPAEVTNFASGGFRGDLSQVGPDGCMYLTQNGARFDDGSVTGQNSLVKVCPNFVAPPGVNTDDPPVANAGPDQTIQCSGVTTPVMLDGSGSSDPNGDTLSYQWNWNGGSATGVTTTQDFNLGSTDVTLNVSDGQLWSTDQTTINVVDTIAPSFTTNPNSIYLWAPNHKYHTITVNDFIQSVSDACDSGISLNSVAITGVSSSAPGGHQPSNTHHFSGNDIVIIDSQTVIVRAERNGQENGRVYSIYFSVTDSSGNVANGSFDIVVLHDLGHGNPH